MQEGREGRARVSVGQEEVARERGEREQGQGGKGNGGNRGYRRGLGRKRRDGVLEREVLKAEDLFRLETLLQHCVEAFRRGFKVDTAIEELVWAHLRVCAEHM